MVRTGMVMGAIRFNDTSLLLKSSVPGSQGKTISTAANSSNNNRKKGIDGFELIVSRIPVNGWYASLLSVSDEPALIDEVFVASRFDSVAGLKWSLGLSQNSDGRHGFFVTMKPTAILGDGEAGTFNLSFPGLSA